MTKRALQIKTQQGMLNEVTNKQNFINLFINLTYLFIELVDMRISQRKGDIIFG